MKKRIGDSNASVQFSLCSRQFVAPGGDIFCAHGRTRGTPALDTRAIISQRQATLILRSRFMVQWIFMDIRIVSEMFSIDVPPGGAYVIIGEEPGCAEHMQSHVF